MFCSSVTVPLTSKVQVAASWTSLPPFSAYMDILHKVRDKLSLENTRKSRCFSCVSRVSSTYKAILISSLRQPVRSIPFARVLLSEGFPTFISELFFFS